MSELQLRIITGFLFGICMIGVSWAPSMIVYLFFGLVMVLGILELVNMANSIKEVHVDRVYLASTAVIFYLTISLIQYFQMNPLLYVGLFAALFVLLLYELWRQSGNAFLNVAVFSLSIIYLLVPFLLMAHLVSFSKDLKLAFPLLLGLLILIWTNDTMAYFTGRVLGKTPVFKRISPKKTVEGTVGGALFTLVGAYVISLSTSEFPLEFWCISALLIVPMSIFGDFFESLLKRAVNVKDSGSILPGHGGILDRFDSLIFSVPIFYFWVVFYLEIFQT